jgi:parvulin-like peptidyl-prolyl isomerase
MKALFAMFAIATLTSLPAWAEDTPPAPATHKPDEVVARVGDRAIQWRELDLNLSVMTQQFTATGRRLTDQQLSTLRYDLLDRLVVHELALREAHGHEPADLDDMVKRQIDAVRAQAGTAETFSNVLASLHVTEKEYLERVREDFIVRDRLRQVAEAGATVTPEEVKKFYDDNLDKMKTPERVRASHILIQVAPTASDEVKKQKRTVIESVLTLLKQGEKFSEMATKYSEDPISARNGGDLGYFSRGQMAEEFEQAAFSLKTNELSGVVTTQFGYHIVLVTDHQAAGQRTFDEVKPDIERYLRQTKEQQVAADYVKKLRESGKYEILLPKPEPATHTTTAPQTPEVVTPPVKAPSPSKP